MYYLAVRLEITEYFLLNVVLQLDLHLHRKALELVRYAPVSTKRNLLLLLVKLRLVTIPLAAKIIFVVKYDVNCQLFLYTEYFTVCFNRVFV